MNRGSGNSSKKCSGKNGKSCPSKSVTHPLAEVYPWLSAARMVLLDDIAAVLASDQWCPAKVKAIVTMHSDRRGNKNRPVELDDPVSALPIGLDYINALEARKVFWVRDLLQLTRVDLLCIRGIGEVTVDQIIAALRHLKPTSK